MSIFITERAKDIKAKYMSMGNWKSAEFKKGARASRTFSKKARVYSVAAPITGWVGGHPSANGYKGGSK